jgi:hypothetical protein
MIGLATRGYGAEPSEVPAIHIDSFSVEDQVTLRVQFTADVGPTALNIHNFQYRLGAGEVHAVSSVAMDGTNAVLLTIPEMLGGGSYMLWIAGVFSIEDYALVPDTVSFTGFGLAPLIDMILPTGGVANPSTNVIIEVVDTDSGVNLDSVEVRFDGDLVFQHGSFDVGYTGTITELLAGYRIEIDPRDDFDYGSTVEVSVDASDNAGNAA